MNVKRFFCIFIVLLTVAPATVFGIEPNEGEGAKHSIKGEVIDEEGLPMPGATVVVVGTTEPVPTQKVSSTSSYEMQEGRLCGLALLVIKRSLLKP